MFQETGSYYHFLSFPFYYCKCRYVSLPTWSFSFNSGIKFIIVKLCHKRTNEEAEGRGGEKAFSPLILKLVQKLLIGYPINTSVRSCILCIDLQFITTLPGTVMTASWNPALKAQIFIIPLEDSANRGRKKVPPRFTSTLQHCNKTHIGFITFTAVLKCVCL